MLIPCYTESLEIVKRTALAAADALLPEKCMRTVYMMDDGKDADKAAWVAEQGRDDIVYRSGRVREANETNGKACNLNNTLKWLYPPEKCVADEEVGGLCVFCPLDESKGSNPWKRLQLHGALICAGLDAFITVHGPCSLHFTSSCGTGEYVSALRGRHDKHSWVIKIRGVSS